MKNQPLTDEERNALVAHLIQRAKTTLSESSGTSSLRRVSLRWGVKNWRSLLKIHVPILLLMSYGQLNPFCS